MGDAKLAVVIGCAGVVSGGSAWPRRCVGSVGVGGVVPRSPGGRLAPVRPVHAAAAVVAGLWAPSIADWYWGP